MTKVQLMSNVTTAFHKAKFQLKKHSPELLVAFGAVSTVAGVVMACKATLKVNDVVDEAKTSIEKIHTAAETGLTPGGQPYTPEDSKKELAIVYTQTGVKLVRLYIPAVFALTAGIGCMLTSHGILRKRNAALAAAYAAVDKGFKEYRNRVVEKFGKEVDQELRYNLQQKEIETTVVDENGKEKVVKETVTVVGPDLGSPFGRFFDETCPDWSKNAEYNRMFLHAQQQWANDKLVTQKYLFLNDVYKALGMDESEAGQVVGWIYDPENPNHKGDNYVDFGIIDVTDRQKRRFVNGHERSVFVDFNVDGEILEKAFQKRNR